MTLPPGLSMGSFAVAQYTRNPFPRGLDACLAVKQIALGIVKLIPALEISWLAQLTKM